MITPTEKLVKAIKVFNDQSTFCERISVDETLLSRLLRRERGASAPIMEKVCGFFGMGLGDAWEIIEGETEE